MRLRWAIVVATALAVALGWFATRLGDTHASFALAKVSNQVLVDTANGGETSFVVYLGDQADVSRAYTMKDQDARGWYVYDTLREHAARTQAPLRSALDAAGADYTPFWAANMIVAEGDRALVEKLAARADVEAIETDAGADWTEDADGPETTDEGNAVVAAETGLNNIKAPSLWALGATGEGIVVANQDTGMRWTHNALRTHYRGWGGSTATSDHNYNWHDSIHARITTADGGTGSPATNSCGYNVVVPCDDQGHGTHTTGTVVGDDATTNQIGAAPGAKWIGCRNMDAGNGRPATYSECFQFFIAPTDVSGQNADPTKRPHVINNSWTCPTSELCAKNTLETIVENTLAAGIFVEVSAGNEGPNCSTVADPPAIYATAFSTGAISGSTNALQSFSSRGPVLADGSGRMKPDLVAPGASVRSSLRTSDTSYGSMSGTSMAGPHVVGAVALLWSAKPRLVRDIARTAYLLRSTANPAVTVANNSAGCGGIASIPNNHFGYGRLDVLAAFNAEANLEQTITFPAIAAKTYGDADFAAGATASSGLPVSYTAAGDCTIVAGHVHVAAAGSCTVTARQAGSEAFYPAADVQQTFAIAKAGQTIDFAALPGRTFGEPDFAVSATASSGLPVAFAAAGSCTLAGQTVHLTGLTDCTITASQAGSGNYEPAPAVARTFSIAWPSSDQVTALHRLLDELVPGAGEPGATLHESVNGVARTLAKGRSACDLLNDLLATAVDGTGAGPGELPFGASEQLFRAGNETEIAFGCFAASSPRPAAERTLIRLLGTIDGMGLTAAESTSLSRSVKTVVRKIVSDSSETCSRLASLQTTILRDVTKDNLTQQQANALVGTVAGVAASLGCV